jgi:hypothetical protein
MLASLICTMKQSGDGNSIAQFAHDILYPLTDRALWRRWSFKPASESLLRWLKPAWNNAKKSPKRNPPAVATITMRPRFGKDLLSGGTAGSTT